jgi:Phytanoyl-CoA dioxygenase (PhyH)
MSLGRCFRVSRKPPARSPSIDLGTIEVDETDEYSQFADRYQLAGATVYEAEPGDALLFSALTIHGSGPNLSSNVLRPYWCSSTPDGPSWTTLITRSSDSCYEGGINMRPESRSHERQSQNQSQNHTESAPQRWSATRSDV